MSYDLKNILFPHIHFQKPLRNNPLLWFGKPKMVHKFKLGKNEPSTLTHIQMMADIPNEQRYENDISTIKNFQYQISLTSNS